MFILIINVTNIISWIGYATDHELCNNNKIQNLILQMITDYIDL